MVHHYHDISEQIISSSRNGKIKYAFEEFTRSFRAFFLSFFKLTVQDHPLLPETMIVLRNEEIVYETSFGSDNSF